MSRPLIIAHRGASKIAPENTMPAFKKALDMHADGIELDVQLTRDGHTVVIHDFDIKRTSNGEGLVSSFTLDELRSFDFGSWFSHDYAGVTIPTLEEVLELLQPKNTLLNIEIKNGPVFYNDIEKLVADQVMKYNMQDRTIISSFNHYSLVTIKEYCPAISTGILYVAGLYKPWEYAASVGADAIHPSFYNIVPEVMKGCLENGIRVNPYTVDDPELIRKIAAAGVSGIITNVPDIALKALSNV